MKPIGRFFGLDGETTTWGRELRAGAATFLTMAYILFVNPAILGEAGMPRQDVLVATALAAALGSLLMGVVANYPFALAPGMGLNAYFAYTVVRTMGVPWPVALGAVFLEGVLFVLLTLLGLRRALVTGIPMALKQAIMTGIGLFLALIGLHNAGLVVFSATTGLSLGPLHEPTAWLALIGLLLTASLLIRRVTGAILLGILFTTALGWALGVSDPPNRVWDWPRWPSETFLALDIRGALDLGLLTVVFTFLFVSILDATGTLIGLARLGGFLDARGDLPRADRAFLADSVGISLGALLGTSTVTAYVESATGIEEGGRTGLVAVVVSLCFLLALFLGPLIEAIPLYATAPALVLVGAFMMRGVEEIPWQRYEEAIPAFLTIALIPLTYSIAHGIAGGIISYAAVHLFSGRGRTVSGVLYVLALLLVARYIWLGAD